MSVFDCFTFFDELDLLECRLEELDDVVDRFVLVEALQTFQGNPKPAHFAMNRRRFERWLPKIISIVVPQLTGPSSWAREDQQRDAIAEALGGAADPDDLILLSDVDELPTAESIRRVRLWGVTAFEQRMCCFAVDWQHPTPWQGTLAARRRYIGSFAALRRERDVAPRIQNAGWHLSWLGGDSANMSKLAAFSHTELVDSITSGIASGAYRRGMHVDGVAMLPVEVDGTWPKFIRERRCPTNWFRKESV